MFCIKCGKQLSDTTQFCPFCGASLKEASEKLGDILDNIIDTPEGAEEVARSEENVTRSQQNMTGSYLQNVGYYAEAAQNNNFSGADRVSPDTSYVSKNISSTYHSPYSQGAEPKKKPSKGIFIAIALAVLAIIGALLIPVIKKAVNYNKAVEYYEAGDYNAAVDIFYPLYLDDYRESENYLENIYDKADNAFESGDYEKALSIIEPLAEKGYSDSWEMPVYCDALKLYEKEEYYSAYKAFTTIDNYKDASDKAEECVQQPPQSSVLYYNHEYGNGSTDLNVIAPADRGYAYMKIYIDGDTLVRTMFLRPSQSVTTDLIAGNYTVKVGYGENWFGESDMFGDDADYSIMQLGENGENETYFEPNYIYTLTLSVMEGNVGSQNEDADNF